MGGGVDSGLHPPILPSSELFSECLPGNFNGCGIWTGKKRRWKFQRKWRFELHHGSTSVCVRAREGGRESRRKSIVCTTTRRTIHERSARHTDDLHNTRTHI